MRRRWTGRRYDTGELVLIDAEDGVIVSVTAARGVEGNGAGEIVVKSEGESENEKFCWISPGWIDLQVNGFAGYDLNGEVTSPEDVYGVARALFARGVTSFCPTVITGSAERISQAMRAIHAACEHDQLLGEAIPGIHLEGPYLSAEDGPRGAHDKAHIREPVFAEFAAWQEAAGGRIALCTVAPEKEGAVLFIRQLRDAGVRVSIGHTMAVAEELGDAVAAGATMSTHLGNGAHPVLPRHPNYIWEQLAEDALTAMFIADGHHLGAAALKTMIRAKQSRFILVSDSVKFGGMPPGRYDSEIGQQVELLDNGRLQTAADPRILAGSAQPLMRGIENAMKLAGVSLAEAIDAVTKRPAEAMGWQELGRLEPGARANLTLFRMEEEGGRGTQGSRIGQGRIQIEQTVIGGRTVWQDGASLW
ncbi:N-acetylglucosamine-6-phosphate deacetylase [Paenibacillus albus]|uniref:N-acetylglucosamine-6-phosphate deacetylase n=1 Tax=Paenibacillus albus TaxID=2495582 RepID=A0A3Q8X8T5_9BACL|nr:amidohydrolase family protein [Paenibacillus albus]AZN43032.1 N-acetylglucosamine-6-phosphate deacetylase [Paenibacillus albus]